MLGAALARAAKQPYVAYVTKNILLPLGMTHTVFEPTQDTYRNLATGYAFDGKMVDTKVAEAQHNGRGYKVPNGAMYSTVGDLAKFVAFELGFGPETILKKQSIESARKYLVSTDLLLQGGGRGLKVADVGNFREKPGQFGPHGYMSSRRGLSGPATLHSRAALCDCRGGDRQRPTSRRYARTASPAAYRVRHQ